MPAKTISSDVDFKRHLSESIRVRMDQHGIPFPSWPSAWAPGARQCAAFLDASNTSITLSVHQPRRPGHRAQSHTHAEPMSPEELGELAHRLANTQET